jgi:hypothetical protein
LQEVNSTQTREYWTSRQTSVRWLDSVEADFKTMGFGNWRRTLQDWDQWRAVVKEA